jgi:hypothetical protein
VKLTNHILCRGLEEMKLQLSYLTYPRERADIFFFSHIYIYIYKYCKVYAVNLFSMTLNSLLFVIIKLFFMFPLYTTEVNPCLLFCHFASNLCKTDLRIVKVFRGVMF